MDWILLVAAVGFVGRGSAQSDIVPMWESYGGDAALAESASVMVFCSCDLHFGWRCNITMAVQFYLQDEPECHKICGRRVECAYCKQSDCACTPRQVRSYRLCQSGNRAKLVQCSDHDCTTVNALQMCTCKVKITKPRRSTTVPPPDNPLPPADSTGLNHRLLAGLVAAGCMMLFLVLVVFALLILAMKRRENIEQTPMTRTNTNSSTAPVVSNDRLKAINNPSYEHAARARPPSTSAYLYPYAPRLTVNKPGTSTKGGTASNVAPQPSNTDASQNFYQELTPRDRYQPPTYEASEGFARRDTVPGGERRQPVYMELIRPTDPASRPPVDTYMY